jgi:hypothetical protein
MSRGSTGTDALVEILDLCEQTLTAVEVYDGESPSYRFSDKTSQSRQQTRANGARRFLLIQGGLAVRAARRNNR